MSHSTFFAQSNSTSLIQLEETGDKHETEKTHVLEPIATRAFVNDPSNDLTYPTQRTAFYLQTELNNGVTYDNENKLWMLNQKNSTKKDIGEA